MNIGPKLHLTLMSLLAFVTAIAAGYFAFVFFDIRGSLLNMLAIPAFIILALIIVNSLFHRFIIAKCPDCGSGLKYHASLYRTPLKGKAWGEHYKGYTCTKCAYERLSLDFGD